MQKYYSITDQQFELSEPIIQEESDRRLCKPSISARNALRAVLYAIYARAAVGGHFLIFLATE